MSQENNPFPNENNTGHVWDETLRELNNPPPKWWMIGLHASWIFVLAYSILYPTWPLINSHTKGIMGWTSINEYEENLAEIEAVRAEHEERLRGMSAAAILEDSDLTRYAVRSAKVLFGDNCAACHGAGGQGNPDYPVLADDDWLYGGDIDTITLSITQGRQAVMPPQGGQSLTEEEIDELARAIAAAEPTSTPLFQEKGCFACHGPGGTGMQALGAPNLTDAIWRFGGGEVEEVRYTIRHGVNSADDPKSRSAEMPGWSDRLGETEIKKLAVYVHQLGGGQ